MIEDLAAYFADELAVEGGYVWAYSQDGKVRRGEGGEVDASLIWMQPPGTPAIGGVYLKLHEITGDARWLDAARDAAQAVVRSQLVSGGWFNAAQTNPAERVSWCYIKDGVTSETCKEIGGNDLRNRSTLDDNISQSALGFLLWLNQTTNEPGPGVANAIDYALGKLKTAQYHNGAWPVRLNEQYPHDRFAAAWRARYPDGWSREWVKPNKSQNPRMLINDNLVRDMIRLLLAAADQFEDETLLAAAMRSGDFLLAAQMPSPQRGWAQAYDADMQPIWGRIFEPPAVASRETAGAIEALVHLYLRTGKSRYLQGATEAADWLRISRRSSGDWARFYELETNRPIFVDNNDAVTYEDSDLREGYGMVGTFGIDAILARLDEVRSSTVPPAQVDWDWIFSPTPPDAGEVADLVNQYAGDDLADRFAIGGWIQSSTLINALLAYDRHAY